MVVRLTPARRATSSSATRRKPWRSNSTTAASRMASVLGSGAGIPGLGELVVAQPHRQMIPQPVDWTRPPDGRKALVAPLLAFAPRQAEQVTGARRHAPGGQARGDWIEHCRDSPPHQRRHPLRAGVALGDVADAVL